MLVVFHMLVERHINSYENVYLTSLSSTITDLQNKTQNITSSSSVLSISRIFELRLNKKNFVVLTVLHIILCYRQQAGQTLQ